MKKVFLCNSVSAACVMVARKAAECSVCQGRPDKDSQRQIQSGTGRVEPTEAAGIESY